MSEILLRTFGLPDWDFWGTPEVGRPAADFTNPAGCVYAIAQASTDPEDRFRPELFPHNQNAFMDDLGVITFGPGATLVVWRLWRKGVLVLPYYITTASGLTYSIGNLVRIRDQ